MAALHERLKPWQRILLGLFCFPLLPFYLCVYCLCLKDDNKDEDVEGNRHSTDRENEETKDRQQNHRQSSFINRGYERQDEESRRQETSSTHPNHINEEMKARQQNQRKSSFINRGYQHHDEETRRQETISTHRNHVNEEMRARQQNQRKSSFINRDHEHEAKKAKREIKTQTSFVNKGYQHHDEETRQEMISTHPIHIEREDRKEQEERKRAESKGSIFKYPWDRSNLKSLQTDLKMFKRLDEYAAKLPATGSLDLLTKQLIRDAHTDLEKVRAIWIWICHHIEYDVIGLKNLSTVSTDPEGVLRSGKSVCAGYSSLFQDMCSRAGVTCKSVHGYGKGAGYQAGQKIPDESNHAWNMVYLEGCWHLLDSTWGAGHSGSDLTKFTFEYNEFYFLTHPALFIGDHYPDNAEHQLLQPRVTRKQFEQLVFRKGTFYKFGLLSVQPETGTIHSENGKVSITIESQQNLKFSFDVNGANDGVMKLRKCGMELDVYPQKPGEHKLLIYAMEPGSTKEFTSVVTYKKICKSVDKTMKIPKCLYNPVGPSWVTEDEGLVEPSHPEPVIYTMDGRCSISFTTTKDLKFLCSLVSDEIQMTSDMESQHVFIYQTEDKVEMKVQLPRSGTYVLQIYIQPERSKKSTYSYLCNYIIICTNPSVRWPVFPLTYNAWAKNYILVHPLEGVLPKNTNVSFKLQILNVKKVSIDGENHLPLRFSDSGYWEGTCSTADRKELIVMTQSSDPNSWQYVLKYVIR